VVQKTAQIKGSNSCGGAASADETAARKVFRGSQIGSSAHKPASLPIVRGQADNSLTSTNNLTPRLLYIYLEFCLV